jgi:hypothetical protein
VWLHFEIAFVAFERAFPRLFEPFLETIHAEAVLASVALQRIDEDSVADAALQFLREHVNIDNSLGVNDLNLAQAFSLLDRVWWFLVTDVLGDETEVHTRIRVQNIDGDPTNPSLGPCSDGGE